MSSLCTDAWVEIDEFTLLMMGIRIPVVLPGVLAFRQRRFDRRQQQLLQDMQFLYDRFSCWKVLYERYQQYIEQSRRIIQAIDKAYPEKDAWAY
jgi:hypothetical protein